MTLSLTKRIAGGLTGLFVGTLLALAAPLTYAQTTTDALPGTPATGVADLTTLLALSALVLATLAATAYLASSRTQG